MAPGKLYVLRASASMSTSAAIGLSLAWTARIARRPSRSGSGTWILRVNRPGPKGRRIERVEAVRGADHDDAVVGPEAIHLDEQLVEGLLALLVALGYRPGPWPSHRSRR